jgi:hypothetical protein
MSVQKLKPSKVHPSFKTPYKKYDEITEKHCNNLLLHLYTHNITQWINPITKKEVQRDSPIIISFLSKCYYVWGKKNVIINGENLKYKGHVEKFIDKEYLYNVRSLPSPKLQSHSIQNLTTVTTVTNKPLIKLQKYSSRRGGTSPGSNSPTGAPSPKRRRIAINVPISRVQSPPSTVTNIPLSKSSNSKSSSSSTSADYSANKQEEERFAREKKEEERLVIEENKKNITKKMKEYIPDIDKYIKELVDEFYRCCDELNNNCDKNGVLREYKYISNVINSIIIVMYTKYLHLPYYYDELYYTSQLDFKVFMYDETYRKYCESKSLDPLVEFKKPFYSSTKIAYQKHDLTKEANHTNINLEPKTIENYHLNTLLNRQHVFEAFRFDPFRAVKIDTHMIQYNKQSTSHHIDKTFNNYKFPDTLKYAKEIIDELDINYNITNSLLPKTIFWVSTDNTINTNNPFSVLTDIINDRLGKLPTITGIAKEATIKNVHYESIIKEMRDVSYGNNETEYGGRDMIRKNILYSLNAQTPTYILRNMNQHKQDIYYNYEYTGIYPLFSWIPLNHENIGSDTNLKYCFPMSTKWQPFGIDEKQGILSELELYYKNHGIAPFSLNLNETIYKVLTDEYSSVKSLIVPQKVQDMTLRIRNTVGAYKDETIKPNYNNKKIYLYHGTKNRLHSIGGKGKEIEVLGFLSTSLNVYVASFYSGIGINNVGLIYIIEVDDMHSYINLNDNINQILILPQSRIRIIMEFNVGGICVVICSLFRTPSVKENNLLYDKLLDQNKVKDINKYETYRITVNNNIMPTCAYILGDLWKTNKEVQSKEYLEIYKVMRSNLNNERINADSQINDEFLYFSLGQEYELYIDRGVPLILGNIEDIKYSIHQHFIKDCYKALDIPCIDYIFIHGIVETQFNKCPISTGILLKDYKINRINHYKYNINNFLIDSIFMFNSIKHDNKKLNLSEEKEDGKIYANKIEGFRDAGAYLNGAINPLFKKGGVIGEHIQYMRDWKHLFIKYKDASNEDLTKHFKWCNKRIIKLIGIISSVTENYLLFISKTLKGIKKTSQQLESESVLSTNSKEYNELFNLLNNLKNTLLERAKFYQQCTVDDVEGIDKFIDLIRVVLSDNIPENTYNSKLYKHAIQEELILEETGSFSGGIMSIIDLTKHETRFKQITKNGMRFKQNTYKAINIDHMKIYEEFKNIPISESKDIRNFKDMPKDMQEYYGSGKDEKGKYINCGKYIDISNNCHFRFVNKKDSES